ncbi:hypothetical protein EJ02DRAFT_515496 [Clathrospora elynae]|uniref:Uncharacterized protein n=1 Tax=Clathrospora elynae TaxID=706981 RepID=A0A6A5SBP0_9PLEO|nr:hypothetical protein EJ02DRAFT_515496 [Clathrospora elynae]
MTTGPKTLTARKAPSMASTPSSKGPAKSQQQQKTTATQGPPPKTQQQRELSISQATTKSQQPPKASNAQAPSKTQQPRRNSAAHEPTAASSKRKIKTEEISPKMASATARGKGKAVGVPVAQMVPSQKRQKAELETKNENTKQAVTPPPATQAQAQSPTPSQSPKPSKDQVSTITSHPPSTSSQLFIHTLQQNPTLLPFPLSSPTNTPIASPRIDAIAHAMWQIAFKHGVMLQSACQYSALFSPLKLAALAKLNYLPSWWFFRDMAVEEMNGRGWAVVDRGMEDVWGEACRWCVKVNEPRGDYGAMKIEQDDGSGSKQTDEREGEGHEKMKAEEMDEQAEGQHHQKEKIEQ